MRFKAKVVAHVIRTKTGAYKYGKLQVTSPKLTSLIGYKVEIEIFAVGDDEDA